MRRVKAILLAVMVSSLSIVNPGLLAQQRVSEGDLRPAETAAGFSTSEQLRFAASQHEIIGVLLDEGNYDLIPGEFGRILELGLSGDNEKLVVQAAWQVVERLREASQFSIAHEIVNATLASSASNVESRFSLLMMRAKVFQDQKLYSQAIESLRAAQALKGPKGRLQ